MNDNAIIAISGQQGSGKSTLAIALKNRLGSDANSFGIKSCFEPLTNAVLNEMYGTMGMTTVDIPAQKQLMLALSTWAEKYVDRMIWSRRFAYLVATTYSESIVISDDIRTEMNFRALETLAREGRQVVIVSLSAPEEIRRERLGKNWRDNASYTEEIKIPSFIYDAADSHLPLSILRFDTSSKSTQEMVSNLMDLGTVDRDSEEHA